MKTFKEWRESLNLGANPIGDYDTAGHMRFKKPVLLRVFELAFDTSDDRELHQIIGRFHKGDGDEHIQKNDLIRLMQQMQQMGEMHRQDSRHLDAKQSAEATYEDGVGSGMILDSSEVPEHGHFGNRERNPLSF